MDNVLCIQEGKALKNFKSNFCDITKSKKIMSILLSL